MDPFRALPARISRGAEKSPKAVREPDAPVDALRFERLPLPQVVNAVSPTLSCVAQVRALGQVRLTYLDGGVVELESPRSERLHRLDFSPDGRYLLANRCQAWHIESRDWVEFPETGHSSSSHAFLFGDRLAVAQSSGLVELFDLCTGERLDPLRPDSAPTGSRVYLTVASSSDLSRLVVTRERSVHLYDADSDRWEASWEVDVPLLGASFSPGGRWLGLLSIQTGIVKRGADLVKTGAPARLLFWDRVTRRITAAAECERQYAFSPRHPLLVTGGQDGMVEVRTLDWSLLREGQATLQVLARIEEAGAVQKLEFVQRGHFLAVTTAAGVGIWKVITGETTR